MVSRQVIDIKDTKFCLVCNEAIAKSSQVGWPAYNKKKYCSDVCYDTVRGKKSRVKPISDGSLSTADDERNISEYIRASSNNGRLMADWNLGVVRALKRVRADANVDSAGLKGIICSYKGIPVTAEMAKSANAWLMDNWIGKAGQRAPEPERDDRTEDQKMEELRFTLKQLGYELVKIGG